MILSRLNRPRVHVSIVPFGTVQPYIHRLLWRREWILLSCLIMPWVSRVLIMRTIFSLCINATASSLSKIVVIGMGSGGTMMHSLMLNDSLLIWHTAISFNIACRKHCLFKSILFQWRKWRNRRTFSSRVWAFWRGRRMNRRLPVFFLHRNI